MPMNVERLEKALLQYDLDLVIAGTPVNVAYLTGFRPPFEIGAAAHQTFVIMPRDPEKMVLIIPRADIANFCTSDLRVNEIETYGRCFQYTGEKLEGVEARVIRLYEQSVKDAHETAVQALIGGFRKRGWHTCRTGIDELPSLCADESMTIEPGMVINVETPYYEVGWGGIQLEDTLVVREDGVEFLSDLPVAFNVV